MKTSKPHWPVTPALLVLCALLSLTACTSAPKKSAPQIIQEPLPESLTAKTDVPPPPARPMTWGGFGCTDGFITRRAGYLQRR